MAFFGNPEPMFKKDTPVLRFNFGKIPNVRWVLWPVFSWRVVAPVPKERKLNLFQRAVLGLARARVTAIVDVANRLMIAPDLAGLIVLELQNMALLDPMSAPTRLGMKMLDDIEEDPPEEARVGHVLSHAFGGKLWPRFLIGDLPVADVELNEDGWPILLSGSAGAPWKDRTFCVLPSGRDGVVMARPDARDVLRAARRHRKQRDYDDIDDERDVPSLQRVSFIDERPQPYLLALRARRHDSGDWMVDDPFGHGEAVELRARLEERLDSQAGLRRWLSPLIGADPDAPTLGQLQTEAAGKVEERLTLAVREFDNVLQRLVAMQRALLEAESYDAPLDKWDDVLVKAQRAVERAFRVIHRPYEGRKPTFAWELKRSARHVKAYIEESSTLVGFERVPPRMLSIARSQVADAERGRGSLRSLVILSVLAARWDEEHPLRRAAVSAPDLIERLDALATARNDVAHDSDSTWPARVHLHVDATYLAVEALLLTR